MLIVVDTNVIVQDFRLGMPSWRLLLELGEAGHKLVVPEIVVQEAVNKFREHLAEASEKMVTLTALASDMVGTFLQVPVHPAHVKKHVVKYEKFLRKKLKDAGAISPAIPGTSHKLLVRRALERRRPFSPDGRRGYRDALIWEGIRELAKTDNVALITLNTEDFAGEDKKSLHSHLQEDLVADGLKPDKVKLYVKVHTFLDEHVIPVLPSGAQAIAKLMSAAPASFKIEDAVAQVLQDSLVGTEMADLDVPGEVENASVSNIQSLRDLSFSKDATIAKDEALVEMVATAECEFDGFIYKHAYHAIDPKKAPFITDHDWNDHYYAVSFVAPIEVRAYVTVDLKTKKIKGAEVLDITAIHSY